MTQYEKFKLWINDKLSSFPFFCIFVQQIIQKRKGIFLLFFKIPFLFASQKTGMTIFLLFRYSYSLLFFFFPLYAVNARTITTQYFSGSGFYITNNGYIATCHHVIEHCSKDKIFILTGKQITGKQITGKQEKIKLKFVASDPENDLAILKTTKVQSYINILFSNNLNTLKKDDTVYIAGYPKGVSVLDFKKTRFVKSQKYRIQTEYNRGTAKITEALLFEPIANHGNSGGPLINGSGHLIGIVQANAEISEYETGEVTNIQNLDIAVPTDKLEKLMINNGIIPPKQESLWIYTDNQIFQQANHYMMQIICN